MTSRCMVLVLGCLVTLIGCERRDPLAPPGVLLGESVCAQCNMIISDQRWATATIVDGPRGPEPKLFDDFNCQVRYENAHPDASIRARWSHDHADARWVHTEEATFLMSDALRTPMGSRVAAFTTRQAAESARRDSDSGDVMDFRATWKRLGFLGETHDGKSEKDDGG